MTTTNPAHVRPGGPAQVWRSFRRWQRSRPFWGGLLTALAGVEMFASTRMTLNGLSFHSGATGLLSLLIPVILVACGLLLWFSPAQRPFYSIVAAVTTVYSLIGLNLGGFFVGLLLGIVGSALAFAWTPTSSVPPAPVQADEPTAELSVAEQDVPEHVVAEQDLHEQPVPEQVAPEQVVVREQVAPEQVVVREQVAPEQVVRKQPLPERGLADAGPPPDWPGRSVDPRTLGVVLVVLGLAVVGLAAQPRAVQAAPSRPTTACPTPSRTVTPSPGRTTATPTPTPSPQRRGNLIGDILDGIGDLFTGGDRQESASPSPSPTVQPSGTPTTRPEPGTCPPSPPAKPGRPGTPDKPGAVEPGRLLPRIAADPSLPKVAQTPSKLTGSSVKMTGLRFDGITDLRTEKGDLKVLKFSMREAVTEDFLLRADGPAGRSQEYATDRLTVSGDVAFYSTRFVGKLLGIKITLTPDLPLPDGIPVTLPIAVTFTDPVIDLAYVTSNTLTARPTLALSLG
ncbi:hypothetical protein FHG89_11365 [Micromonospora orduensis]|uniref:Uncharacterized protein n=1 Tax=Micromonospora orduensis TaxID=1420891 RepID=A0A5C4QUC6_9ACTN|nr:DUF6114 domain-containing protein [Micromonospora orduensis]TNH29716.1 hypothetical protein FHG89_11365 [Micromonospora orduensis]